jgi:hypothetical protein
MHAPTRLHHVVLNRNKFRKSVLFFFLDFVHHLYFNKTATFRKLDLLPSSGKKGRTETLAVWSPGWASLRPGLPEDGRRSSFRNVENLLKYRRWTKSKKTLLQITEKLFRPSTNCILKICFRAWKESVRIKFNGRRILKWFACLNSFYCNTFTRVS